MTTAEIIAAVLARHQADAEGHGKPAIVREWVEIQACADQGERPVACFEYTDGSFYKYDGRRAVRGQRG